VQWAALRILETGGKARPTPRAGWKSRLIETLAMRLPQFRLRSLMIVIAFLALLLTLFVQTIFLQRAMVRSERYRAETARFQAIAEMERQRAEATAAQMRAQNAFYLNQEKARAGSTKP
jgi:hypothetical protein